MMPLPLSFTSDGFVTAPTVHKGLLIGTQGHPNTGKTEFAISGPGPGVLLALDRGVPEETQAGELVPSSRNLENFAVVPIRVPVQYQMGQKEAIEYWTALCKVYYKALANKDARTVVVDGDSDGYELQTFAEFGKLIQIPPILRSGFNAVRKAYVSQAFDSGKIVIMTNKLKRRYEDVIDEETGVVKTSENGNAIREWDGVSYDRAGIGKEHYQYLYRIQLEHLHKIVKGQHLWGVRILMCKPNRPLEGMELWGEECNMPTLLSYAYPNVPLERWGYTREQANLYR